MRLFILIFVSGIYLWRHSLKIKILTTYFTSVVTFTTGYLSVNKISWTLAENGRELLWVLIGLGGNCSRPFLQDILHRGMIHHHQHHHWQTSIITTNITSGDLPSTSPQLGCKLTVTPRTIAERFILTSTIIYLIIFWPINKLHQGNFEKETGCKKIVKCFTAIKCSFCSKIYILCEIFVNIMSTQLFCFRIKEILEWNIHCKI